MHGISNLVTPEKKAGSAGGARTTITPFSGVSSGEEHRERSVRILATGSRTCHFGVQLSGEGLQPVAGASGTRERNAAGTMRNGCLRDETTLGAKEGAQSMQAPVRGMTLESEGYGSGAPGRRVWVSGGSGRQRTQEQGGQQGEAERERERGCGDSMSRGASGRKLAGDGDGFGGGWGGEVGSWNWEGPGGGRT